jgi:hypothetical protein
MIKDFIKFIVINFTLTFFLIGIIAALISFYRHGPVKDKALAADAFLKYYCLFAIGFTFIYNAIVHIYFHAMSARIIGWADSPFQIEVGTASLGFGVIGVLAFRKNFGLRLAAVIGPSIFLLGAAVGHIYQMMVNHNFAPGNAGIIFYTDWIVPLTGFIFLYRSCKFDQVVN